MNRSKWKGPFLNFSMLNELNQKKIKIFDRSSTILPQFIGLNINVYNGKRFILLKVTELMVGHKFGEFALTKQPFKYKKK